MSDDFKQWKQAMNSEYKFLKTNFTWNLVKLFSDWCALKNKWIFYYKQDFDDSIIQHKTQWGQRIQTMIQN
jgi:hypothetical protein